MLKFSRRHASWQSCVKTPVLTLCKLEHMHLQYRDFSLPDRDDYLAKVRESQREIFEGNSYEVCLTAETSTRVQPALDEANLSGPFI